MHFVPFITSLAADGPIGYPKAGKNFKGNLK
jgi:hypothetical protein